MRFTELHTSELQPAIENLPFQDVSAEFLPAAATGQTVLTHESSVMLGGLHTISRLVRTVQSNGATQPNIAPYRSADPAYYWQTTLHKPTEAQDEQLAPPFATLRLVLGESPFAEIDNRADELSSHYRDELKRRGTTPSASVPLPEGNFSLARTLQSLEAKFFRSGELGAKLRNVPDMLLEAQLDCRGEFEGAALQTEFTLDASNNAPADRKIRETLGRNVFSALGIPEEQFGFPSTITLGPGQLQRLFRRLIVPPQRTQPQ